MTLSMNLRIVGILLVLLGLSHAFFSRYFGWERELADVSLLTRQIFFVHSFFHRDGSGIRRSRVVSLCRCIATPRLIEQDAIGWDDGVLVMPTAGPVLRLRYPHLERRPISHVNARSVFRPMDLRDRHLRDRTGDCLGLKSRKNSLHRRNIL